MNPVLDATRGATVQRWHLDEDGTRYTVITVAMGPKTLVAAAPDQNGGMSAFEFLDGPGFLAQSYVAEKLRLRNGDDTTNMTELVRAALRRPERHPAEPR